MNFEVIRNTVNVLLESMDFVNMYGEFPLDKETLEKFHTLQSRLKREFDVLDIETEFMSSDSIEVGFYLKKLDESLSKSANGVKMMLVKQEELVQRRNMLIEKLKAENEDPVIVRYNSEIFQQVMTFRYDIEKYADSIIAEINKLHQIHESPNEVSQSQEYEESGDCLREVRRDTESVGLAANCINNTDDGQCGKDDEEGDLTADDILLRTIFGKHLPNFLKEAKLAKTGTGVARIVNNYVREYDLKKNLAKTGDLNKPLWQALSSKGIIKIKNSAWNSAIK